MGIMCQILLQKQQLVYKSGQPVRGIVKYALDESTKLKNITLSLTGKAECKWSENDSANTNTTRNYFGKEEFLSRHINVLDKKISEVVTLPIGFYEYPFEFILPPNIPSSYKDCFCKIRYRITLKFEKASLFSFNKSYETEIIVYGNVASAFEPEPPPICGLEKTLFSLFATKKLVVNVKAEADKSVVLPGGVVNLQLSVANMSDVEACIKLEVVCVRTYFAECGRKNVVRKTVKESTSETPEIRRNSVANIKCQVPIAPELYSIQHTKVMTMDYVVVVTLRLPLPHLNSSVEIPIVVGERQGKNEINMASSSYLSAPPSYLETMMEDKCEDS